MSRIDLGRGQARPEDTRHADSGGRMGFDHQDRDRAAHRTAAMEVTR